MVANGDHQTTMSSANHQIGINESGSNSVAKNSNLNRLDQQQAECIINKWN